MITPTQMYWFVILDDINFMSGVLAFVFGLLAFFTIGMAMDDCVKPWVPFVNALLALVLATVVVFTPSTKQMAAIIVVPKIANSEKVQTVGNKIYDLAVEWMDELRPHSKEQSK